MQLVMLLSVGVLFAAALLTDLAAAFCQHVLHAYPDEKRTLFNILGWLLPALLLIGASFCLYRFIPRKRCNWKSALIGAVTASALFAAARALFAEYVNKLADYSEIYGWLATAIVLLVWAYIAGVITVFCGELVSHVQMMIFEGVSGKEITKRHRARSPRKKKQPFRT